jgi:hypothetical protein
VEDREYELELFKAMAWERDALHRLYYPFWILFMAGFVLSLRVPFHWCICLNSVLLVVFRFLAVLGTGLNFMSQHTDLTGISCYRWAYVYKTTGKPDEAKKQYEASQALAGTSVKLNNWLLGVTITFLATALVGSFLMHVIQ